jgi:hypothetical protein
LHFEEHRNQLTEKCNSRAALFERLVMTLPQMPEPAQEFPDGAGKNIGGLEKRRLTV